MNDKTKVQKIVKKTSNNVVERSEITPTTLIHLAVSEGHDLDKIEKLMELERIWKADRAREEFYKALTLFKQEKLQVTKDKENKQYNSSYTSIGNLVNTVNSVMAPFGLTAHWKIDQAGAIKVTCILSHTLGHSESVSMIGPPDESGRKNQLQQIKSTITYLQSSTFQAVTGVISQDHDDDDGNSSTQLIDDVHINYLESMISEVSANRSAFLKFCKINTIDELPMNKFKQAVAALDAKR